MRVGIFYGSGGGNTELVCQRIAEVLVIDGHEPVMCPFKLMTDPDEVHDGYDILLFASPTYGHGLLEKYADIFVRVADKKELDLEGKPCIIVGLGDIMYDPDYFIESARTLAKFVRRRNGLVIGQPLMIAESPIPHLDQVVPKWIKRTLAQLENV